MSQREMLHSPKGFLLLLLSGFGGLVLGEIGDFSHCLSFFYMEAPPKGIDGKGCQPICQRYKNHYHFASLYQRQHRAPLYSAYILTPPAGKRPPNKWMYEPQLAFSGGSPEMHYFPRRGKINQNVIESQAVPQDYTNSTYTRGHLNPSQHHTSQETRQATFTLTNVVPQQAGSNSGPWAELEVAVSTRLGSYCKGPAYVITGALPYLSGEKWIKNRVAVPEYLWSAYCCPSYSSLPESVRPFFPTYAAVGRNDQQSGEEIVRVDPQAKTSKRGYDVQQMPLEKLEAILKQRLAASIKVFYGQCL